MTATRTQWILEIPDWRPMLANELLRHHPRARGRLKAKNAEAVALAATRAGIPLVSWPRDTIAEARKLGIDWTRLPDAPKPRRRRVVIEISGRTYGKRPPDRDGPLKCALDALVHCGLLVDDDERWCAWEVPIFEQGPKRTVFLLEDI